MRRIIEMCINIVIYLKSNTETNCSEKNEGNKCNSKPNQGNQKNSAHTRTDMVTKRREI